MRILFVASRFPYPPIQGDRLRAYQHLRYLARQHPITLLAPIRHKNELTGIKVISPLCEHVEIVHCPIGRSILNLLRGLINPLPFQTLFFYHSQVRQHLERLLRKENFDVIHVQLVRMAPVAIGIKTPRILDLIDSLSLNMLRRSMHESLPLSVLTRVESRRIYNYEQALVNQYDYLTVSSMADKKYIGNYDNLLVVPSGVDIDAFPFVDFNGREPNTIIFTGRLKYFPNIVAIRYFVDEIFPVVREKLPSARFLIVGAEPPRWMRELGKKCSGIEVIGYVPNIHEYLSRASVAVAPLQIGSGFPTKIAEAMASGTPVVATPQVLEAMDVQEDFDLLIGKNAEDFAEKVVLLLQNKKLAAWIARNARRLIEEKYTWEKSALKMEQIYQMAVSRR
jgi:sugar transferase (PEP-CTERM/EpsH1 system associated)